MGYDVLTSGYVSLDHIIKVLTPVKKGCTSIVANADHNRIQYGGCSVNIAAALSTLGINTLPLIRVGEDFEQSGFKRFLEEKGIATKDIQVIPKESTSACYLLQDCKNDHYTIYYPGAMDGKYASDYSDKLFQGVKLGVITVASVEDNQKFLKKCNAYKIPVAFGMKDDFDAFPKDFLTELLEKSKYIFMNEIEEQILKDLYKMNQITDIFQMGDAQFIITTHGEQGSICYEKESKGIKQFEAGICRVEKVVDTTGSGDAYMSGFLYGMLRKRSLQECCRFGAALASFVIQKEGCCTNLPTLEALTERMRQQEN